MSPPNASSGQPRNFIGRVVLITGAGSGVGFECARVFAAQDAKLLLVGRSADKLEAAVATLTEETKAQAAICTVTSPIPLLPSRQWPQRRGPSPRPSRC